MMPQKKHKRNKGIEIKITFLKDPNPQLDENMENIFHELHAKLEESALNKGLQRI
jgi:hypothetical protein